MALDIFTCGILNNDQRNFTPACLEIEVFFEQPINNEVVDIAYFCTPVVHPITGETISKSKRLALDQATKETWTTAFGKDFGNMAQGGDKQNTRQGISLHYGAGGCATYSKG